jgi:hypothetical protein
MEVLLFILIQLESFSLSVVFEHVFLALVAYLPSFHSSLYFTRQDAASAYSNSVLLFNKIS